MGTSLGFSNVSLIFWWFIFFLVISELAILAITALPLQKAEQNLTPRILDLFREDPQIAWIRRGVLFTALALIALLFYPKPLPVSPFVFVLIGLGISFDLLHALIHRIFAYLNPYKVSKMFTNAAEKSILQSRETDLCDSLESLSEICLKALDRSSPSLCNQTLDEMREILRVFLQESKSIATRAKIRKLRQVASQIKSATHYFISSIAWKSFIKKL